jgi:hypothetical protein
MLGHVNLAKIYIVFLETLANKTIQTHIHKKLSTKVRILRAEFVG